MNVIDVLEKRIVRIVLGQHHMLFPSGDHELGYVIYVYQSLESGW